MQKGTSEQTLLTVRNSQDPDRPLTVSFLASTADEDGAHSGYEMDLTIEDARAMARLILEGVRKLGEKTPAANPHPSSYRP